ELRRRRRRRLVDQRRGVVDEHARGLAALALDAAAVRLPVAVELALGLLHRGAVRPARVPVDALEPDRALGERAVEVGGARERALGPVVLVPATAEQPRALGQRLLEGLQPLDDLLLAGRADEVGAQQR